MITLDNISITAGAFQLDHVSLKVPHRHYGILMGATGTGKTTLLEAIAGLIPITNGSIIFGTRDVTSLKPAERNIGYVPQDSALFSKMNVRDHLAFSLVARGAAPAVIKERIDELSSMLGLREHLHRGIRHLSGGEKQRVALGRALASHPATLLLDEPLSALDEKTRNQMYQLLRNVQKNIPVTILHVTHHVTDARCLADTLLHLSPTGIEEIKSERVSAWMDNESGAPPKRDD